MKNTYFNFCFFILIFVNLTSFGQNEDIIVSFNPQGNLSLGSSINIHSPKDSKLPSINFSKIKAIDGGSPSTTLKANLVSNTDEFFSSLNIDINRTGEINIPVLGGGNFELDLKMNLAKDFSNNTLYYIIHAFNDFGRFELDDVSLKSQYKSFIKQKKYSEFIRSCGTHYVKRERRVSSVYAIIKISNINRIDKKKLELKHGSALNFNIKKIAEIKTSEKNNFDLFIKSVSKIGKLEINYYSRGTSGMSVLGTMSADTTFNLVSILNTLNSAIKTATPNNAVPIEYHLASFYPFGLDILKFNPENWSCVSRLINTKVNVSSQISKITNIINNLPDKPFTSYYKSKLFLLEQKNAEIETQIKNCEKNEECCKNSNNPLEISWFEDLVSIDTTYIVPNYTPLFNSNGQKIGTILKSINFVVEGIITNADYYCCLSGYEMNENLDISNSVISPPNHSNPAIKEVVDNEDGSKLIKLRKYQFQYVIGRKNLDFSVNSNGNVVNSNENRLKIENTIDNLKKIIFIIEAKGIDLQNNYFEIGTFDFSKISTLILR